MKNFKLIVGTALAILTWLFVISIAIKYAKLDTPLDTRYYTVKSYMFHEEVYLSNAIVHPDNYKSLVIYLLNLPKHTKVKLYLSGNGGSVASTLQIVNALEVRKAETEAIVYGNVYSAHAFIALSMDKLTILDKDALFLFHLPAIRVGNDNLLVEEFCKLFILNVDRTINAAEKCLANNKVMGKYFELKLVGGFYRIATFEDRFRYNVGEDVILTAKQISDRLLKLK